MTARFQSKGVNYLLNDDTNENSSGKIKIETSYPNLILSTKK